MNEKRLRYQICVRNELDPSWTDVFGGLSITCNQSDDNQVITTLTGRIIDQAHLFGILSRIRDLGLYLISVNELRNE